MKIAKKVTLADYEGVRFDWANGEDSVIRLDELSETMLRAAACHGLSQKGGDCYAGVKGDVRAAQVSWHAVMDAVRNGDWNQTGHGTGGQALADLIRAIQEDTGREEDEVRTMIESKSKDELKAINAIPRIKAAIAGYVKERADAKAENAKEGEAVLDDLFAD